MTELYQALWAYLRKTGLAVYLADQVPDGATFPYATFAVEGAPFPAAGRAEVTGWHRGSGANAGALGFLDDLRRLIPERGMALRYGSGVAVLYPACPFSALVADGDAIGGRASLELYCLMKGDDEHADRAD